jgi:hypothetical protein
VAWVYLSISKTLPYLLVPTGVFDRKLVAVYQHFGAAKKAKWQNDEANGVIWEEIRQEIAPYQNFQSPVEITCNPRARLATA